MTFDMIQSIVRAVLNATGGIFMAKGIGDAHLWEAVTGGSIAVAALVWSAIHQKQMKATATDAATGANPK